MKPIDMIATDINCEDLGLSRLCLMENAGKSLSDEVAKLSTFTFSKPVKIAIFTGSGGNGGDGFVAARHLLNRGFEVDIFMLADFNNIKSSDAKTNALILKNMSPCFSRLAIHYIEDANDLNYTEIAKSNSFSEYIIIDAILGTGIKGKLRNKIKKTIEIINNSNALKIAVDIPSGMDSETGEIHDMAIKPNYTITFHKIKSGVKKAGEDFVGGIITSDIGIPIEAEIFVGKGDLQRLKKRDENSHKGNNGKILIVGGNGDYVGAPSIAGLSALSVGVDLVYIYTSRVNVSVIKSYSPDFIVKSHEGEYLTLSALDDILAIADNVDAVLLGPGAGLMNETGKLFNILVSKIKKPIVLDADALKSVDLNLIKNREDIIITPHLNEFKSFFSNIIEDTSILDKNLDNLSYMEIHDKIAIFQEITKNIKGTVVLKGKYDLIFNKNNLRINKTGNPGMTVGGTGDSLGGVALALLSQGLNTYDAGALATYINGKAGDFAQDKYGNGFRASTLSEFLGKIIVDI
ncbi:bifunctional ADP-dependent NAD(P)H-hydrate dehydratase/NAD(P)H-hydrate epimerase [Methanobrevibacter filiformis]|uniref:Bifunctional NAD(P)H-hydrate repair enzyme n=1 Tax=Methanobrevibacter filiformis TaxID=55758 RepID=A0A165ZWG8_9EURY|nr:bifunctional ADP-dependent NAD(P)H-hydrate dehydratase/NAD(P)H-hydrate epimerase [Methanobrevibacter filiformis]KZX11258.1 bifunctional NAD(P)H-hydrate repair enzyme Nnr [Methanobrevibacter filiformis]